MVDEDETLSPAESGDHLDEDDVALQPDHPYSYPPIASPAAAAPSPLTPPSSLWPQCLSCAAATVGSFLMGTALGWSGPALTLLQQSQGLQEQTMMLPDGQLEAAFKIGEFPVSDLEASVVASFMPLGALFGGLSCGYFVRRLGRKPTMLFLSGGYAMSYLMIVAANCIEILLLGRFLTGVCSGGASVVVPLYIAETSSPSIRGTLGTATQLAISLGIVFVDCLGLLGSWRWLSVACLSAALVWVLLLLVVPESPSYLLANRQLDGARRSLQFLRGHDNVDEELSQTQDAVDASLSHNISTNTLFRERQYRRPLLISLFLMAAQQLSGVNAVLFFSVSIFEAAGTPMNSFVEAVVVGVVQVVGTLLSALAVDRAGRRVLLMLSAAVMAVALVALGVYFWLLGHNPTAAAAISFLPLASLGIFILFFALGFGPVPWLMMSELFTPEAREKASSISASFNWSLATLVTQFYSPLASAVGADVTFWVFAVFMLVALVAAYAFIPETKGRTLEEIQAIFREEEEEESQGEGEVGDNVEEGLARSGSQQQLVTA